MSTSTPGFDDYDLTGNGFSRGSVTSGVHVDNAYPLVEGNLDEEQERRLQARQESDFVRGNRADRPEFTRAFPNDHVKAEQAAAEA